MSLVRILPVVCNREWFPCSPANIPHSSKVIVRVCKFGHHIRLCGIRLTKDALLYHLEVQIMTRACMLSPQSTSQFSSSSDESSNENTWTWDQLDAIPALTMSPHTGSLKYYTIVVCCEWRYNWKEIQNSIFVHVWWFARNPDGDLWLRRGEINYWSSERKKIYYIQRLDLVLLKEHMHLAYQVYF